MKIKSKALEQWSLKQGGKGVYSMPSCIVTDYLLTQLTKIRYNIELSFSFALDPRLKQGLPV